MKKKMRNQRWLPRCRFGQLLSGGAFCHHWVGCFAFIICKPDDSPCKTCINISLYKLGNSERLRNSSKVTQFVNAEARICTFSKLLGTFRLAFGMVRFSKNLRLRSNMWEQRSLLKMPNWWKNVQTRLSGNTNKKSYSVYGISDTAFAAVWNSVFNFKNKSRWLNCFMSNLRLFQRKRSFWGKR